MDINESKLGLLNFKPIVRTCEHAIVKRIAFRLSSKRLCFYKLAVLGMFEGHKLFMVPNFNNPSLTDYSDHICTTNCAEAVSDDDCRPIAGFQ
mmetsp:Transcript_7013/g.12623  ORF Transcript_7013/g.12623 Transcript_7013/m.12623 type:complete len:93 (+) Transcript_7013:2367-2645(+)